MNWGVAFGAEPGLNDVDDFVSLTSRYALMKRPNVQKSSGPWVPDDIHIVAPSIAEDVTIYPKSAGADVILDFVDEHGEAAIEYAQDVTVDFSGAPVYLTYYTGSQDVLRGDVPPLAVSKTGSIVDLKWLMRSPYAWLGLIRRLTSAATDPYTLYELYVGGYQVFVTFVLTLQLHAPGDMVLVEQPWAEPRLIWFR